MLSTHSDEDMATGIKSRMSSDQDIFPLIHSGDIPCLQSALSHVHNLNFRDSNSQTPLMHAMLISNDLLRIQVIRLLLRHGCDVNAQDEAGCTVLMYACMDVDKIQAVRQLAKCRNCDPNVYDVKGNTALMHCVRKSNAGAIKVLTNHANIQHRLRVNVVNRSGNSALEMAIHLGLKECCRILLKDGQADTLRVKHHGRLFLKSIEEEAFCSNSCETSSGSAHSRQSNLNPMIMKRKGLCYTSNDKTVILASSTFDQSFRNKARDEVFLDNNSGSSPHLSQDNTDAFTLSMPGYFHCSTSTLDKKAFFTCRPRQDQPNGCSLPYKPGSKFWKKSDLCEKQAAEAEPSTSLSILQSPPSDNIPHSTGSLNEPHRSCSIQTVKHLTVSCPDSPQFCIHLHRPGVLVRSKAFSPEDEKEAHACTLWKKLLPLNYISKLRFSRVIVPMTSFSPLPQIPHGKTE